MCGRYSRTWKRGELSRHFKAEIGVQDLLPRFNVAPTQNALVLKTEAPRVMTEMRWGWETPWSDAGQLLINAKAESVAEKRTFKEAFRSRRCLVVADGFYEWRRLGKEKQPVRFTLKSDEPFAFAGIWQESAKVADEKNFLIVTTEPNDLVRPVHTRMPVILKPEDYERWLSPDSEAEHLRELLRPFPEQEMKAYDVNPIVNSAKNESAQCIEPYVPAQGSLF